MILRSGIVAATFLFAAAVLGTGPAKAAPMIPLTDATVVEILPDAGNPEAQQLRRLQLALTRAPNLLDLALRVAALDIQLGQSETDPRYDGRAEAALAPWIDQPDPPTQVRLMRAILRQRVHNFSAALADLDAVLASDPGQPSSAFGARDCSPGPGRVSGRLEGLRTAGRTAQTGWAPSVRRLSIASTARAPPALTSSGVRSAAA